MSHDARAVANVMIKKGIENGTPLTPLQIIKLTYLCQAWMLAMFRRKMFRQEVQAWEHGPVIPDVYHSVKKHGSNPVKKRIKHAEDERFDSEETHILDEVFEVYGHWTGFQLSNITHLPGTPWYQTRSKYPLGRSAVIPQDLIEEFYGEKLRKHRAESAS